LRNGHSFRGGLKFCSQANSQTNGNANANADTHCHSSADANCDAKTIRNSDGNVGTDGYTHSICNS